MPELSPRVRDVRFDPDLVLFELEDGRVIGTPLAWFPRLDRATPSQRLHWEQIAGGNAVHWPEIDEDLSVSGLLGLPN
jgi:hypothetical protein